MKKNGFTLAEVLITLSIIGVVATLTLPSLMTNTGEAQYKAGLKKAINTLSEAGQMASALDGFDYNSMTASAVAPSSTAVSCSGGVTTQSLTAILKCHAQLDTASSTANEIIFRDGSSIMIADASSNTGVNTSATGLMNVTIDVNSSKKGPNLWSTCSNAASSSIIKTAAIGANITRCDNPSTRAIKDRFVVNLVGTHVEPQNDATVWALQK